MNNTVRQLAKRLAGATALLALAACDNSEPVFDFVVSDSASTVSLSPPPELMTRAVVQQALSPRVTVNGEAVTMAKDAAPSENWSGSTIVPPGTMTTVEITWEEDFGPNKLALASIVEELGVINSDTTASFGEDQYVFDIHDDDEDGFSNLVERINNTDPYDSFQPGAQTALVFINQINANNPPIIDGAWDPTIWPNAQFRDRNRAPLGIKNLMVDQGATQADQEPTYRWGVMHDAQNLYLLIFTESVAQGQTPFSDSADAFHDDSIDIFIDGDNSKGDTYDGVNDFQLIIPMFEAGNLIPNNSRSLDARFEGGFNALPFPAGVEFAACRCNGSSIGEYTLEVKIPLAEVGISIGQPFGIEIQYNDDKDGLTRDAKWGWFHPSKTETGPDVDFTWQQPKFMGTAQLEPPPG